MVEQSRIIVYLTFGRLRQPSRSRRRRARHIPGDRGRSAFADVTCGPSGRRARPTRPDSRMRNRGWPPTAHRGGHRPCVRFPVRLSRCSDSCPSRSPFSSETSGSRAERTRIASCLTTDRRKSRLWHLDGSTRRHEVEPTRFARHRGLSRPQAAQVGLAPTGHRRPGVPHDRGALSLS
jgi:hypothetical protein